VQMREATDDGSRGHHGRVTELVEDALAEGPSVLAACGPNSMLGALASLLEKVTARPPLCEASFEAPMGCGFGTCLGCALPVHPDGGAGAEPAWALCCREGPVMAIGRVDWTALRGLPPPSVA
jgi:dihydroorotate dehydrogenase electron transfer subunit